MKPTRLKPCTQGDIGDERILQLTGVASLTGVSTVTAKVWLEGGTPVDLAATVLDETERTVTLKLGTTGGWLPSEPIIGMWHGQLHLTWDNGDSLSWPAANRNRPHYFELPVQERDDDG